MTTISMDLETRSEVNLFTDGSHKYARHPSTSVLCYAYKIDDQPTQGVIGEVIPPELEKLITSGATISGWNISSFDRIVWNQRFPQCQMTVEQMDCSMDRALACGLPAGLDKAARFMGLSLHKDKEGHKLMKKLCQAGTHRPAPTHEELERLLEYCIQDVEVEAALAKRIPPLPEYEKRVRALSHKINETGFMVDVALAEKALVYAETESVELAARLQDLTGGQVQRHTQRERLFNWLTANGCKIPNLQKQTLEDTLDDDSISAECREAIDIRLSGAKASTAKFAAAVNMACDDDRVRGTFQYFGAPATGRWSGRGLQPHNLPRACADDPWKVMEQIENKEVPSVYKALSSMLRPMIMAPEGKRLVRCDFSAIEGRVVAWLANDKPALEEYRGKGRMYERAAVGIYGGHIDAITKSQRQIGKVAELALGFQGGHNAFNSMARNYGVKVPTAEAKKIVKKWRASRPAVVKLWADVESAAIRAYRAKGKPVTVCDGKVFFVFDPQTKNLWIGLPSGRFICLPGFRVTTYDGPYGTAERLTYKRGNWTPKQGDKEWPRADTYGGSLVESLAQGIARDLLAEAMLELEDWGIVLHVHDEVVCEVETERAEECLENMEAVMAIAPKWAKGLPLQGVGEISLRFGK